MGMIGLGCNYSPALLALVTSGQVDLDWIKLSRGDTLEQEIALCRPLRPALVHTLGRAGLPPHQFDRIDWTGLNRAIEAAGSPHIALHLGVREPDLEGALSPDDCGRLMERVCTHVHKAASALSAPLLLENLDYGDPALLRWCTEPSVIRAVVVQTGTSLLLDTAHLRCSAYNMGLDPYEYAAALPLERVREIHVAGPAFEQGMLRDRHRELQEEDYSLLAWLLDRTAPLMVTLEYGGTGPAYEQPGMTEPEALRRQLHRLKGMLS